MKANGTGVRRGKYFNILCWRSSDHKMGEDDDDGGGPGVMDI